MAAYGREHGGADAFLTFIEEELKPWIEREFKIDGTRQAIIGHSLGGLFVLHTLFTKPGAFRTYVAGSPSIHWSRRIILDEERQFASRLEHERMDVRVLLAVGELKKSHKSGLPRTRRSLRTACPTWPAAVCRWSSRSLKAKTTYRYCLPCSAGPFGLHWAGEELGKRGNGGFAGVCYRPVPRVDDFVIYYAFIFLCFYIFIFLYFG